MPSNRHLHEVSERLHRMLNAESPDAAIIIPVNARGDLYKVLELLDDISRYDGPQRFQIILVVNNFDPAHPPREELELYDRLGVQTLAIAELGGHAGVTVMLRARMQALPLTTTRACVFLDADCRIPNARECLDWYCAAFRDPAVMLAYTRVGHYNWPDDRLSMRLWLLIHYGWRACKRTCLRIPTPRGSSYALDRDLKQQLYDEGYLADETAIGRLVQSRGHKSAYSGVAECEVLTDGRVYQEASALRVYTGYALRRLRINFVSMFIRKDAAERTGRKGEGIRGYDDSGGIRTERESCHVGHQTRQSAVSQRNERRANCP